jgi:hypothetical protein
MHITTGAGPVRLHTGRSALAYLPLSGAGPLRMFIALFRYW